MGSDLYEGIGSIIIRIFPYAEHQIQKILERVDQLRREIRAEAERSAASLVGLSRSEYQKEREKIEAQAKARAEQLWREISLELTALADDPQGPIREALARAQADCEILQHRLEEAREEEERLEDRLRREDKQYRDAQHALNDKKQELQIAEEPTLDTLGTERPRRNRWSFLVVGALGVLFGLLSAVTIVDILAAIALAPGEPIGPRLYAMAAFIGIFAGLLITVLPLWFAEQAAEAQLSFFHRWAPFIMGLFLAVGLGGYRLVEATDTGLELHLTPIGLVLMCAELALLMGIEFVHHVTLRWWEAYVTERKKREEELRERKRCYEEQIKPLEVKVDKERRERDQAEVELQQHREEMRRLRKEIRDLQGKIAQLRALEKNAKNYDFPKDQFERRLEELEPALIERMKREAAVAFEQTWNANRSIF